MRATRFLWSLLYSLAWLFSCICSRAAGPEVAVNAAQVTEAPQVYAGQLDKRDSPLCGYLNGDPNNAFTCNAPNDCYFFTATTGFYAYKAACGTKGAATSYAGPYGLCVNFNAGLCPNVASCSSQYGSVLFCASRYPYCVRYEMRENPSNPSYFVMLDCTTASIASPIQIYFTPTRAVSVPTVSTTTAPSPIKSTIPPSTTTSTTTSTTSATTTTTTSTTTTTGQGATDTSKSDPSQSSSGLSVGDRAAIAGSVVAGLAIITGILGAVFPNEFRRCLSLCFCCCCIARSHARYAEVPMNHM